MTRIGNSDLAAEDLILPRPMYRLQANRFFCPARGRLWLEMPW
jgi:hypothetical protein